MLNKQDIKNSTLAVVSVMTRLIDRISNKLFGSPADVEVNTHRRRVLTLFVLGGGAVVASSALGSAKDLWAGDSIISERIFNNFIVRETGNALTFFDKQSGEEILIIDK